VEIRRARPDDAAAVAEVHTRTWQAAYEHVFGAERLARIDEARRLSSWQRTLAGGDAPVWVAVDDGRVVGFAMIGDSREDEREGELYAIYVVPEAWGTEAGRALMGVASDALRKRYATAILWVLDDNPRARRFYEREGWAPDGAEKTDEFLGLRVREVRYRVTLS
jgi:GNAT superfamily N-acetyltransferase